MAQQMIKHFQKGMPIAIVGDSEFLINCCLGKASTDVSALNKCISICHEALRHLVQSFSARPFGSQELVVHTPRKDNSAADAAANEALDHGDFLDVHPEVIA